MADSEHSVNVGCYHLSNSFVHLHLARNCIIFWKYKDELPAGPAPKWLSLEGKTV